MATTYQCPACQKKLHVPVDGAGKKVKCPGCGTVFVLPVAGSANSLLPQPVRTVKAAAPALPKASQGVSPPQVNAQSCPSCQAPLGAGAALCVSCGLDLRTGKKLHRPLSLEPTKAVPVALIAAAAGGLAVVAVGALILTWVLSGDTKPVQVAGKDAAKTSGPAVADANSKSSRVEVKSGGSLGSAVPPALQEAKSPNASPKASDVVEEFIPANLTKLVGRKVRWTGTTLGEVAGGQQEMMLVLRPGFMANIKLSQASTPALAAQSSVTFEGTYEGVVGNISGFSAGGSQTGGANILGIHDATVVGTKVAAASPQKVAKTPAPVSADQAPTEPPRPPEKAPIVGDGAAEASKAPAATGGFRGRSKGGSRPQK